jgi:two-component system NtrC family sensor kinase
MVKHVMLTKQSSDKNIILSPERLKIEGKELIERCFQFGGEPRGMLIGAAVPILKDGNLLGILQMGNLLNGATEVVDTIREIVFENKQYRKRPVGTATIFMGDLRISTNVLDDKGKRAIGTRVSREVADHVLGRGNSWTGRAWVVNAWYLSQYDPIKDPEGHIIGMLYMGELEEKYLDMRTQAVISHLSVIIGGMILAFLVFFFITRTILRPVHKLVTATKRLSERDLSYRVSVQTNDEVGSLSKSFNQMAEQLQERHREIRKQQEALERTNQKLKVINRNYMEMLGFVSHELKNPLSSAILGLHTVKDGYLGTMSPSQKKALESVAQSLDYFHDMIKNYLDLSRLEKGEIKANKGRFILHREIVAPLLEELEAGLNEKKMRVEIRISPELEVFTDRNLLRIVYDNLLSNAIKYGKQGGTIVLDAQKGKSGITMSVWNEGSGIPQGKMNRLFRKFSRLDNPEYAGKKGTGLGLFICKEIIEKQGGRIWVESEEGRWVKFTFTQ